MAAASTVCATASAAARPDAADVEAREVGLGARQLDGRAQARVDAALREVAVHLRAVVRLVRRLHDRLGREDGEVGLLDAEVDVEARGVGAVLLDVDERVGGRALRADAAEVEHLLREAGADERRGVRREVAPMDAAATRAADARDVDESASTVGPVVLFAVIAKSCAVNADAAATGRSGSSPPPCAR